MIRWLTDEMKVVLQSTKDLREILSNEKIVVTVDKEYTLAIANEALDEVRLVGLDALPLTTIAGAIHWISKHAVSHRIRYGEETFVITGKEAKDYVARLAVLAELALNLKDMTAVLHEVGEIRRRDINDLYTDALTRNCDPTDIQCLIKSALKLKGEVRERAVRAIERKLSAIKRLVQRHNFIVEHVQLPLERVEWVKEDEIRDKARMDEYFRTYPSYVEFNGEVARFALSDVLLKPVIVMPIITGVNNSPRFTRFVLNIVSLRTYMLNFTCDGSWMLGIDKTTNQPFTIALPRNCLHMPIQVCVEYVLGLRNARLRPTTNKNKNTIEIIEV
jgi:hypothetical protein